MRTKNKPARKAIKRAIRRMPRKLPGIRFEPLETRQMMAVINVADFGARPNDGVNDLAAIQAAINASSPGDTILFSGGTFDLSGFSNGDGLTVPGDRTYLGQNGATLSGHGSNGQLITLHSNNVTFEGLTFSGGGVFVDNSGGGFNQNIVFDSDTFELNTSGNNPSGITATSGLQNSRITNNYFTGYNGGGFGIYGYNYNTLTIANNEFVNVTAGMHFDAFGNSGNLLVEQNYITGAKGMGMEFQGAATNLTFQDNWFENPNLSTTFSENGNSMAFSLILDKSSNITIRRNTVLAPQRPDGAGCRIGFEVGGDNTVVEDNYVNGINHVLAVNDGVGSCSVTVKNNRFQNVLQNASISFLSASRTWQNVNNGPGVQLTWDINRARPGIGAKRYGGTGGSTATTPTAATPVGPTGLAAIVTGPTEVNLFWTDRAYDETGYKVEQSTDGTTWTEIATLGADAAGYAVTGLTAGQAYSFRVCSFNASGNSDYSNVASVTPNALNAAGATYVSDLQWTSMQNYWGPAERDMSNGETAPGDGHMISLAGRIYAKGLGVHAGSEIHYQLNGNYSTFASDIGLDDETNGNGAVVFEVWADGQMLYSSGTLTAADGRKSINVDVSGKQELVLIVTKAGDNNDFDHADWADARLLPPGSTLAITPGPAPNPTPQGSTVYLSDLPWSSVANGWGPPELDKSNGEQASGDGNILTLNGKTYGKGLGVHATSDIRYNLDGKYAIFSADIGIDDEVGGQGSVAFQVFGDGVKLYDSGLMTGASQTKTINVNVQGRMQLWLVVNDGGDGKTDDHADWADARVTLAATATQTPSVFLSDLNPASATNGWGPVELDSSVGEKAMGDGSPLRLHGQVYSKGLGVNSDSKLVYQLDGQFTTFTTDVGIDDEVGSRGSVVFRIIGDGVELYNSGVMTGSSGTRTATVNVAGKSQLWLVVDSVDDPYFDHADWANAHLTI